jgi:hypothetical protein
LQGTLPRCKKWLPSDSFQRRQVIEAIVYIHNFRTEIVGLIQIKTVFDPEYEWYQTLEGYYRISQYYLELGDYNTDDDEEDVSIN